MFNIVLYQPKIPPNTGNIIRFCANTGLNLHLIHPLGFSWEDKQLRRAGLDYQEFANIVHHDNWDAFLAENTAANCYLITTKGTTSLADIAFKSGDFLIFGAEDSGIAPEHMQQVERSQWLRIPMLANSRSMNLSNTVAIVGYEALRQHQFPNLQ